MKQPRSFKSFPEALKFMEELFEELSEASLDMLRDRGATQDELEALRLQLRADYESERTRMVATYAALKREANALDTRH